MQQGHFHVHTSRVRRAQGHSAVAASAYQSGQQLTHEGQRHASIAGVHRKDLNKGIVSEALREALVDLPKEIIDPAKRIARLPEGIALSDAATIEKLSRTQWRITDGEQTYTIKEHRQYVQNPETGRRKTTGYRLDVYRDHVHDYTTKEHVQDTWLSVAPDAPSDWRAVADKGAAITREERERAWNQVEHSESNRDAVSAIKVELSYLRALSLDENKAVTQAFIQEHFTSQGLVVDAAIHRVRASDGKENTHVHLLVSTRPLQPDGQFAKNKHSYWNQGLNDPELAHQFRKSWADKQNALLERLGKDVRVDPRSYAVQGLEKEPGVHVGQKDWNTEKRRDQDGRRIRTLRGDKNREAQQRNAARQWGVAEQIWRYSQAAIDAYYFSRWHNDTRQSEAERESGARGGASDNQDARQQHTHDQPKREQPQRPARPRSREEREMLARMQPYMNSIKWDHPRDKAHFIATTLHAMLEQQQRARRNIFEKYAGKHEPYRYRGIHQDRPLPTERTRERKRERGR